MQSLVASLGAKLPGLPGLLEAFAVHCLVVCAVLAAAYMLHPRSGFPVPPDGVSETFLPAHGRPPAKFGFHFCGVDRVAAVVAGPVRDEFYQVVRLAEGIDERTDDVYIAALVPRSD